MDVLSYIDTQVVLAFLLTFLGCYLFLRRRKDLPPGPVGLPFVGNIFWFFKNVRSPDRPGFAFLSSSKKYGDLIYATIGRQGFLAVNGYDTIHEVFVKNAELFSDRPHWMSPQLKVILQDGRGLIWQSGDDWKKIRKFALQSMREFGVGKSSLEEKIFAEIDAASEVLRETAGQPYDIQRLAGLMIANVIYGIVFGKRFEYDNKKFHELIEKLDEIFERGGALDVTSRLPNFLMKLIGRDKAKLVERRFQIIRYIRNHISGEISEHEKSYDANNMRDFIDLYIQQKQTEGDNPLFTVGNVFRMILDLFLAGSETTSNTVIWSVLYMIENPDVQTRCQDELKEKYGEQDIRWSHRNTLPYVEATLMEIQRLANVAEMSLPHTNEVEAKIQGYTIPRHTIVQANLLSSNLDPRHWDEPEKFNPERFLDGGKLKKNPAFLPFSTGPRICAGESLAKMEMFLVFTNFLQRFTFKRENADIPTSFKRVQNKLTATPVAFKTRIIPRHTHSDMADMCTDA